MLTLSSTRSLLFDVLNNETTKTEGIRKLQASCTWCQHAQRQVRIRARSADSALGITFLQFVFFGGVFVYTVKEFKTAESAVTRAQLMDARSKSKKKINFTSDHCNIFL